MRKLKLEHLLYGLVFVFALLLRFWQLDLVRLPDWEAQWALQALHLSTGSSALVGAEPGYILWTSILFFLLGSAGSLALFWPAVTGSVFVLTPYLFRDLLGNKAALVLAALLAFDPVLLASSRQASGSMIALTAVLAAIGFWRLNYPLAAGVCAGLALFGGSSLWPGVLALGLVRLWRISDFSLRKSDGPWDWKLFGIAFGAVVFAAGTLLMSAPGGLSGVGNSLIAYLEGWRGSSETGIFLMLLAWVVSSPLMVVLGLMGVIVSLRGDADPIERLLGRWWLIAFVLVLIYPARSPMHLVWPNLALLALAARRMVAIGDLPVPVRLAGWGLAAFTLAVGVFGWSSFVAIQRALTDIDRTFFIVKVVIAALVITAAALLVWWAWSSKAARFGFSVGLLALLAVYTFSAAERAAGLGIYPQNEMLRSSAYPKETDLLINTIGNVSKWNNVRTGPFEIWVEPINSAALDWALRGQQQVKHVQTLPSDALPAMVITGEKTILELGVPYTGQDFVLSQRPAWNLILEPEWVPWLLYRKVPTEDQTIVLWVRSDLFPGAIKLDSKK